MGTVVDLAKTDVNISKVHTDNIQGLENLLSRNISDSARLQSDTVYCLA